MAPRDDVEAAELAHAMRVVVDVVRAVVRSELNAAGAGQRRMLLRTREAAELLGISRTKFFELLSKGVIPQRCVVRIPSVHGARFDSARLQEWIESLDRSQGRNR